MTARRTLGPEPMAILLAAGLSAIEVARLANCSRQWVYMTLDRWMPGLRHAIAEFHRTEREWKKTMAEFARRVEQAVPCVVCQSWVLRIGKRTSPHRTCSTECAGLWQNIKVRWRLDPEYRRQQEVRNARYVLLNPGKFTSHHVKRAFKVLAGEEPAQGNAGQRWVVEDDDVFRRMKRLRPDVFGDLEVSAASKRRDP